MVILKRYLPPYSIYLLCDNDALLVLIQISSAKYKTEGERAAEDEMVRQNH